jgi:hypothetical protein
MTEQQQVEAVLLDLDEKYAILRDRVAELAAYAEGLDNPRDAMQMITWLRDKHAEAARATASAWAYATENRRAYSNLLADHTELANAVSFADTEHPLVDELWDLAEEAGEQAALSSLIVRIGAAQRCSLVEAGNLLVALEAPDAITTPHQSADTAARLRALADRLDTIANEKTA